MTCWPDHGFLVIDKDSEPYTGRYRKGIDNAYSLGARPPAPPSTRRQGEGILQLVLQEFNGRIRHPHVLNVQQP